MIPKACVHIENGTRYTEEEEKQTKKKNARSHAQFENPLNGNVELLGKQ